MTALHSTPCEIFLYCVNYVVSGLIKKLTGQWLDKIRLGKRTRLRRLGRRMAESEELPARCREETVGAR